MIMEMNDMKILVTMPISQIRSTFFPPEVIKRMESIAEVEWNETENPFGIEELKKRLRDVDVCMTGWGSERFDSEVLESADKLKVIAHTGGSVATIVSNELYEKGIIVLSGNPYYAESVAEGAIAYMLCSLRRIVFYQDMVQNGGWASPESWDEGLLDQSLGLVGFGAIAKFLTKKLAPFRVKIKAYDPYVDDEILKEYGVERASLEDIFSKSKIISIHAAKTPDTYHLVGSELLQAIPDGALLVNTARSSIINTAALEEELQKNRFQAVLDVFDEEPLPKDSKLIGLPNVLLMPHRGGPTTDRWRIVTLALIDDILRIFDGKEPVLAIEKKYAMAMSR